MKRILSWLFACTTVMIPTTAWEASVSTNLSIAITGPTFDLNAKASNVVLSNNNLTAAINSGSWGSVRSTTSQSSGKYYLELTVNQQNGTAGNHQFGLMTAAASPTTVAPSGSLMFDMDRSVYLNGTWLGWLWNGATTGHVLGIALDLGSARAWVKDLTAGTGWNNGSAGTQDPGSGTGGISFSGLVSPLYFAWSGNGHFLPADRVTANFGGSAFSGEIPMQFSLWNLNRPSSNRNVYTPITGDPSYKLVFDDEFNGTTLDTTTNWIGGISNPDHVYPGTSAQFIPGNTTVHDGCADLTVTKPAGGTPNGSKYGTAVLNSNTGILAGATSSVYWEARLKYTPSAVSYGIANVYWTNASPAWTFPEIDFSEWWAFQPRIKLQNWIPTGYPGVVNENDAGVDLSAGWHVWGTLWTPNAITFYVDGVQTAQTTAGIIGTTAWYALIHATVGGGGIEPDETTVFPSHYLIDYVHVYSNASGAVAIMPQADYGGPGDAIGSTACQ